MRAGFVQNEGWKCTWGSIDMDCHLLVQQGKSWAPHTTSTLQASPSVAILLSAVGDEECAVPPGQALMRML